MISKVLSGSQAEAVRLQLGDILLKYNGRPITSVEDLTTAKETGPGLVEMVLRRKGETVKVSIPRGPIGIYTKQCFD